MEHRDKQVSVNCMAAVALWSLAVLFTLAGTVLAIGWAGHDWARSVGLALMAHSMLFLGGACVLSVRLMLRQQTRLLLDAHLLTRSGLSNNSNAGQPVRSLR
jgi:hypothetical protein